MAGSSDYIHLEDVEIRHETDAAFLILYRNNEFWVPKSQVADPDNYKSGDKGCTISITDFIANKRGIT